MMKNKTVRIVSVSIRNFKNIISGDLSLENPRKNFKASVLGLYGQNGSGKTGFIDAMELLQMILCGRSIPDRFADYINVDAVYATFRFDFNIQLAGEPQLVSYQFDLKKSSEENLQNTDEFGTKASVKACICNELLKCPVFSEKQIKIGKLIDTKTNEIFLPKPKRLLLVGKEKETLTDLIVAKRMTQSSSRSFIFSREFLSALRKRGEKKLSKDEQKEFQFYQDIIESLVAFGNHDFFVINISNSDLIGLNEQPLVFKCGREEKCTIGTLMIPIGYATLIPSAAKPIVRRIIKGMNGVLKEIIPGLTISLKELGTQALANGDMGVNIQLMSHKNSREIPLCYESEGIKKIIAVLQLLIVVYNDPGVTVVIDELDSGIFEYLLGEILHIISEKGKGQLLFTSHNLRPLETLDRGFIAFTTTNPENRYVRMANVKENNNLRDFYYRDIMLGEQKEELYQPTKNAEIAFAFREAGESIDA